MALDMIMAAFCHDAPGKSMRRLRVKGPGEFAHQSDERLDLSRFPVLKNLTPDLFARRINSVGHDLAFRRDHGFAYALVRRLRPPFHQSLFLQLAYLTAYRGVVASGAFGEVDNTDRPETFDPDQQGKQGAIEPYAGLANKHFVNLRTVHEADDIDHRTMQGTDLFVYMCILHISIAAISVLMYVHNTRI